MGSNHVLLQYFNVIAPHPTPGKGLSSDAVLHRARLNSSLSASTFCISVLLKVKPTSLSTFARTRILLRSVRSYETGHKVISADIFILFYYYDYYCCLIHRGNTVLVLYLSDTEVEVQ